MPFLKRNAAILTFLLGVIDSLVIFIAYVWAVHMTQSRSGGLLPDILATQMPYLIVLIVVWCGFASDQRLFASRRDDRLEHQLWAVTKAAVYSLAFTVLLVGFFSGGEFDQRFLLYYALAVLAGLLLFRISLRLFLWLIRSRGYNYRQVVIAGANKRSKHLIGVLTGEGRFGYQILGVVDDSADRLEDLKPHDVKYLGPCGAIEEVLSDNVVDEVYITLPLKSEYDTITDIANKCERMGVPVRMIADFFPLRIAQNKVQLLEDVPLLSLSPVPESQIQLFLKRALDLAGALFGLIFIIWWLFPLIAVAIKLDSKGPVFFTQERVGLNRRRFKMLKFRSMVADAEAQRKALEALNEADGPVFKIRNDPRITRVGRFLRKTSLDELPQLLNVLVGDMSLVGPRPPIPSEVEEYTWEQQRRLSVKPGMTGLWQVSGRSDLSFREWVELDLVYIDTWNILNDLHILLRTVQAVVKRSGAA